MFSVLRGLAGSSGLTSRNAYSKSKNDCEMKKGSDRKITFVLKLPWK